MWEAASLTKPVVAAFVLQLAAGGEIDLDATLDVDLDVLGAVPDPRWAVLTARHVLTHTSGLPNWRGPMESVRAVGWDVDAVGETLRFEADPGRFGYSGEAFEVLLHALGRHLCLSPTDLLEPVLSSLGMHQSSFVWQSSFDEHVAIPHRSGGDPLPKAHPLLARAAGSLHTTLTDYAAFAVSVLEAGSEDVFRPSIMLDDIHGRSLGWGTVASDDGVTAWQHGDNPGFKHVVVLHQPGRSGVLMFTNGDEGDDVYRDVCRRVLGLDLTR